MNLKAEAARAAADLVENGMILGLGTGSTASLVVRELGRRLRAGALRNLRGVPTSRTTETLAREEGISLLDLEEVVAIDLTLDGADEVDPEWNLIKGAGGSLLREKIVAQLSEREAIVVDESKLVSRLGEHCPLPVEVIPFGWTTHETHLRALGGEPVLRLLPSGEPFVTDEGNYIIDVRFEPGDYEAFKNGPRDLDREIRGRAGIIETGLFLGIATDLIIGRAGGVESDRRDR